MECSICCDNISANDLYTTTCNHKFHKTCLKPWIITYKTCPNCRKDLTQEEIERREASWLEFSGSQVNILFQIFSFNGKVVPDNAVREMFIKHNFEVICAMDRKDMRYVDDPMMKSNIVMKMVIREYQTQHYQLYLKDQRIKELEMLQKQQLEQMEQLVSKPGWFAGLFKKKIMPAPTTPYNGFTINR